MDATSPEWEIAKIMLGGPALLALALGLMAVAGVSEDWIAKHPNDILEPPLSMLIPVFVACMMIAFAGGVFLSLVWGVVIIPLVVAYTVAVVLYRGVRWAVRRSSGSFPPHGAASHRSARPGHEQRSR